MSWEYLREASPEHPELISPAAALESGRMCQSHQSEKVYLFFLFMYVSSQTKKMTLAGLKII